MNGHVGPVSSVTFDHKDSNKLYSGGWDHSIRIWDVEARTNIDTKVSIDLFSFFKNFNLIIIFEIF